MATNGEGPRPLKVYRLYHIGIGGGVEAVSIVDASEDADAMTRAEELLQTDSGELWLENTMVAQVRRSSHR